MATTPQALLLHRADLASLAAVALESDFASLALWHRRGVDAASTARTSLVRRHAELLDVRLIEQESRSGLFAAEPPHPLLAGAADLVEAVLAALHLRIDRVIWPVQTGPVVDAIGRCARIAHDISSWSESAGGRGISIDLPVVELTDRQMLEIVADVDMPLWLFWPCERGGSEPCTTCQSCRKWVVECDEAGFGWPWAARQAGSV